jgi:endonuclease YncB( thermonuclease family)
MDVTTLTPTQLNDLEIFTIKDYTAKAVVTKVVDGDTLDLVFSLPLSVLVSIQCAYATSIAMNQSFILKRKGRLTGLNAAEISTPAGKVAAQVMTEKYASLNNILYAEFHSYDKYGRALVTLYADEAKTISLNQFLLDYVDPTYGHVAVPMKG